MTVGDTVRLISVPQWLIHDLPLPEQWEIVDCIGQTAVITELDAQGNYWIGFGKLLRDEDGTAYCGHSLCVTGASLETV